MDDPALYNTFLDLHNKLGKKGLNIILGGGYGLYLKQLVLMSESSVPTLLPVESWPRPRSSTSRSRLRTGVTFLVERVRTDTLR